MWQLTGSQAELTLPKLRGQLALDSPCLGMQGLHLNAQSWPDIHWLQIHFPEGEPGGLTDAYVRQHDLVATYDGVGDGSVRVQVYWRILPDPVALGHVEVMISTQTDSLDADPKCAVSSLLPVAKMVYVDSLNGNRSDDHAFELAVPADWNRGTGITVASLSGGEVSHSQYVFPADFVGVAALERTEGACQLMHQFFHERIEKGVIRRSRCRSQLLEMPLEEAKTAAITGYRQLIGEKLPLTA